MQPQEKFIKIEDNVEQIRTFLNDLIVEPSSKILEWSKITQQSPRIKVGYLGQHLASLITGMPGERTGARGNDIIDGTEVKTCSRVDQMDKCNECSASVSRYEDNCPECDSTNIERKNDSKWLIAVRSENELETLINHVNRFLLIIEYYPGFDEENFDDIRIEAFEIWLKSDRQALFAEIMTNYYKKIYLEHIKENPGKTPAPKNFWPFKFQFYLCNPIKVFSCDINNIKEDPDININEFTEPTKDRNELSSVIMPPDLLYKREFVYLLKKSNKSNIEECLKDGFSYKDFKESVEKDKKKSKIVELFKGINENLRKDLPLRDTDEITIIKKKYERSKN